MGEVVRIVRQQFLNQERAPEPDLGEEGVAASTEELLKDYQAFLQAPQTYSVPCELHLVAPQAEFGCLLGLQVVARPPADWGSAQGVQVPVLWKSQRGVRLMVYPKVAEACALDLRAEFTVGLNSYVCMLAPLEVCFEDLLVTLPGGAHGGHLWDHLWHRVGGQRSVLCLGSGKRALWEQRLSPWLVRPSHAALVAPRQGHVLLRLDVLATGPVVASLLAHPWWLLAPMQVLLQRLMSS